MTRAVPFSLHSLCHAPLSFPCFSRIPSAILPFLYKLGIVFSNIICYNSIHEGASFDSDTLAPEDSV